MIQRFFLWQVLNLFERPRGAPLGVVLRRARRGLAARPGASRSQPGRRPRRRGWPSSPLAMSAVRRSRRAGHRRARLSPRHVLAPRRRAPRDDVDGAGPARRTAVRGRRRVAGRRAGGASRLGGLDRSGSASSSRASPSTTCCCRSVCMLAAIGIDLVAIGQHAAAVWPGRRGQVMRAALTGAALLVAGGSVARGAGRRARSAWPRRDPTIDIAGIDELRPGCGPTDRVACTDELACLLLVGRVDAWLALDDYVRERFVVTRGLAARSASTPARRPCSARPISSAPGPSGAVTRARHRGRRVQGLPGRQLPHVAAARARGRTARGCGPCSPTPQARVVEIVTQEIGDQAVRNPTDPEPRSASRGRDRPPASRSAPRPTPAGRVSTNSSIGSPRSAASISSGRARVTGCRGVNSVQQSSSGWMEMS